MPTPAEIQRIAAAMNAIRPAWRISSLVSFLTTHHANRAYQDLAVAGVVVALDTETQTPNLLNRHGAWWIAAQAATGRVDPIRFERCPKPGHTSYPAHNCGACRVDSLEPSVQQTERVPSVSAERVRQILDAAMDEPRRTPDAAELASGDSR